MADTDTQEILRNIIARHQPLSWFAGDWPLHNHFYRPVTTLAFEFDQHFHPGSLAGFGLTNAVIAAACVLALFWFMRELTDRPLMATASAVLFSFWTWNPDFSASWPALLWILAGVALAASLMKSRSWKLGVLAFATVLPVMHEVEGLQPFRGGIVDWLPGRTASVMAFFALIAMAAFARSIRVSAPRVVEDPNPLDPPATRNTEVSSGPRSPVPWIFLSVAATALALGAYEQAVMIPAVLVGIGVSFRLRGYRPKWGWHAAFWILLLAYFGLRRAVVPSAPSGYQLQQYRASLDVFMTLTDYALPPARDLISLYFQLDLGFASLLVTQLTTFYRIGVTLTAMIAGARARARNSLTRALSDDWVFLVTGYALSFLAFLPMAWFKPFPMYNHYHYWALAIRSLFAVMALSFWLRLALSAVSPRSLPAPLRLVPAPGSLPHP